MGEVKHRFGGIEPAFPSAVNTAAPQGMSLRDWFAGQALAGICSHRDTWGLLDAQIVTKSYVMADAMLAERSKP